MRGPRGGSAHQGGAAEDRIPRASWRYSLLKTEHSRDGPAGEGDEPERIDGEAYPMEGAVDPSGPAKGHGGQGKQEMEGHSRQRENSGDVVPFRRLAVSHGDEVHLAG